MSDCIKVFICDDHTLFRQGIKKLLVLERDIKLVGEANNGVEMMDRLKTADPDIILMDIGMPEMDGVTATYNIKTILPDVAIIILTVYEDEVHIFEAIKAGAMGYLLKDVSIDELLDAIRKIYTGGAMMQPIIAHKVLKEFISMGQGNKKKSGRFRTDLSRREEEVLELISQGDTNRDIGDKLGISEKTVKNHVSNIFQILHVNNRTQAARYASNNRL